MPSICLHHRLFLTFFFQTVDYCMASLYIVLATPSKLTATSAQGWSLEIQVENILTFWSEERWLKPYIKMEGPDAYVIIAAHCPCACLCWWVSYQEQQMCTVLCHWGMKINLISLSLQTAFIHDRLAHHISRSLFLFTSSHFYIPSSLLWGSVCVPLKGGNFTHLT